VSLNVPCPICRADLELTPQGEFDSWICPAGHGRAATLSELYERAQEDEIHRLWALAKASWVAAEPETGRACPMCSRLMVTVVVPTDADEADERQPGDRADTGLATVDVCVVDEVIWFEEGEVEELPADLPDAEPTAAEDASLAQIRRDFAASLDEATGTPPAPGAASETDWPTPPVTAPAS
jgi:hypothetical protein